MSDPLRVEKEPVMPDISYVVVDAPTPRERRFGLYSVADVAAAAPHELQGIEFERNDNCRWSLNSTTAAWCGTHPTKTKTEGYDGTSTFAPFALYALEECAGPSGNILGGMQKAAITKFNIGEERGVEERLEAMVNGDAGFVDLGTAATTLRKGLAALEQWLDANYAGSGTILMSREAASMLTDGGVLSRHGNRLETELGNTVAASNEFGGGPTSAGAGNTWLKAVGLVQVRRGLMFASDPTPLLSTGTSEVQALAITGTPTGGTYTLTFNGETTAAIAYNAVAATIQTALINLAAFVTGDVVVTGTAPNFTITFGGNYASTDVPLITTTSSLTGGTSPAVTVTLTTSGSTGLPDNSWQVLVEKGFVLSYDCAIAGIKAAIA